MADPTLLSDGDRRVLVAALECYSNQMKQSANDSAHSIGDQSLFYELYEACVRLVGLFSQETVDD